MPAAPEDARSHTSISTLLTVISAPYARSHPGRLGTVLLSVSLGVAAIVASGNLIQSALASIQATWQMAPTRVDFRIANGFADIPDDMLARVRDVEGVEIATAVIASNARAIFEEDSQALQITAIDLFGEDPIHRDAMGDSELSIPDDVPFLTRVDAVVLERAYAESHDLEIGETFEVALGSGRRRLLIAGLVEPNPATMAYGGAVALMDLPAAQVLLAREGLVSAIDVRIAASADRSRVRAALEQVARGRATVSRGGRENDELASLIATVRLILGIPGILAIVIGSLVIHQSVAAAVSFRKPRLDIVRSLGCSRRSLLSLFAVEGLIVGGVGSGVGVVLGNAAAPLALGVVRGTVGSLYRTIPATQMEVSWGYLAIGVGLGVGITLAAFLAPGRAAIGSLGGLNVVSPSRARWQTARKHAWLGAGLIPIGLLISRLQETGLTGERLGSAAAGGDALIMLGAGLLVPVLLLILAKRGKRMLGARRAVLPLLALQGLSADPARSGSVVTALLVGCSYVMITVGCIGSVSNSIAQWLDQSHVAELVVASEGSISVFPSALTLPAELGSVISEIPGISRVETTGSVTQPYGNRWSVLVARRPGTLGSVYPLDLHSGDIERARRAMNRAEGGIVSRHFAIQHNAKLGDTLSLRSPSGKVSYRVEAIVNDLSSTDLGTIFVSTALLADRWHQTGVNAYHVWLDQGADRARVQTALAATLGPLCACSVSTGQEVKAEVNATVDALFYVAYGLEVVAAVVVVMAVVSFFSLAMAERAAEISTIYQIGATRRQLVGIFLWEAAFIGALGSILGCAIGVPLARRMTYTTMKLSGGMEVEFILSPQAIAATIGCAVLACTIAGLAQILSRPEFRNAVATPGASEN